MIALGRSPLLVLIPLWMSFGRASERFSGRPVVTTLTQLTRLVLLVCGTEAALTEPQICYVLDGILFLYGIILTALYCRIKIYNAREFAAENAKGKQSVEEGIYTGLTPHAQDTYETIGMKK